MLSFPSFFWSQWFITVSEKLSKVLFFSPFFCVYVGMNVYIWSAGIREPWYVYGHQRKTSNINPFFLPYLKQGLQCVHHCVLQSSWHEFPGLISLEDIHLPSHHKNTGITDACYHAQLNLGPGTLNSSPYSCIAVPLLLNHLPSMQRVF